MDAPRGPKVQLVPEPLKFKRTPGASLIDFLNLSDTDSPSPFVCWSYMGSIAGIGNLDNPLAGQLSHLLHFRFGANLNGLWYMHFEREYTGLNEPLPSPTRGIRPLDFVFLERKQHSQPKRE